MDELKEKKKEYGRVITDMDIEAMILMEVDKYHVLVSEFLKGLVEKFLECPAYIELDKAQDIMILVDEYKENILVEADKHYSVISRFTRGYEVVADDINYGIVI